MATGSIKNITDVLSVTITKQSNAGSGTCSAFKSGKVLCISLNVEYNADSASGWTTIAKLSGVTVKAEMHAFLKSGKSGRVTTSGDVQVYAPVKYEIYEGQIVTFIA